MSIKEFLESLDIGNAGKDFNPVIFHCQILETSEKSRNRRFTREEGKFSSDHDPRLKM